MTFATERNEAVKSARWAAYPDGSSLNESAIEIFFEFLANERRHWSFGLFGAGEKFWPVFCYCLIKNGLLRVATMIDECRNGRCWWRHTSEALRLPCQLRPDGAA